jgi:DNA primase
MHSPAQEIKERLSISDVVSSYIKLEKAGVNWKACCPFHNEKTASFVVSPGRGTYHCFGCNRGGDIFSFVEEIEGVEFRDALEKLASRAGVALKAVDPKEVSRQKALYDCMELATRFFEFVLKRNPNVIEYLHSRGLTDESIEKWRVGYAPADWRKLVTFLREKKIADEIIETTGLAIKGDKGMYDRFRGRIMFPIFDGQGRVVAFSGRIFDTQGQPEAAKYVNSPETPLYNKSKILYGYDKAKISIMREDACVLVEGQVDLVMAHQAGTANAVAVSGTALTEQHLGLIKRFTENLIMSFDGDSAGLTAAKRGVMLALSLGMDVKIAALPEGMDPADVISKDAGAWTSALAEAKHIIPFYLEHLSAKNLAPRELIKEVSAEVLPFVALIKNHLDQSQFIKDIAKALGVTEETVELELARVAAEQKQEPVKPEPVIIKKPKESIRQKIAGIVLWQESSTAPSVAIPTAYERYKKIMGHDLADDIGEMPEAVRDDFILQAEVYYAGHERLQSELDELMLSLEDEALKESLALALTALRSAPDDPALVRGVHDIQKRRDEIRNSRFLEK